ncbi:MAG: metal-dependent hydrolase [Pseudomonadota bacterium]
MKLTWLGHSAYRIDLAKAVILIDPFLTGNPTFTLDRNEVVSGCTHVLLSHGHADHVGDTLDIAKETGATVFASYDLCMWLNARGLERFEPAGTGGTVHLDGFSASLTIAHHSATHLTEDGVSHGLGNPNGLVVKAEGERTLYHMGDTDIFGDMALINEIHEPKIGIVPVGDRFTMGARTAALACRRFFDFDMIVPCHYGTFPIIDQTADAFLTEMGGDAGKVQVCTVGSAVTC